MTITLKKPDREIAGIEYYNSKSVAETLKVSPITARYYFRQGYFPQVKFGHSWYVSKDDLEFFVINGRLKKREELSYKDYKSIEKGYLAKIEGNLKKIEKELEYFEKTKPAIIRENLTRRHSEIKKTLEEYKKDKMNKKDYDTFVE